MELSEFISKTIQNIDLALSKTMYVLSNGKEYNQRDSASGIIDFDILVSTTDTDSTQGGGKIQVVNLFTGGLNKEKSAENQQSSRIKFQIKRSSPVKEGYMSIPGNDSSFD